MSRIDERGRLACITKNLLSPLSLSLLHAIHEQISLTQARIFNRAADSLLGLGLKDNIINLAIIGTQEKPKAMFSNYVTVYGVKNDIGPSADRWERSGSGLIIHSDSLDKLHRILGIF